jgi:hypothetical protein
LVCVLTVRTTGNCISPRRVDSRMNVVSHSEYELNDILKCAWSVIVAGDQGGEVVQFVFMDLTCGTVGDEQQDNRSFSRRVPLLNLLRDVSSKTDLLFEGPTVVADDVFGRTYDYNNSSTRREEVCMGFGHTIIHPIRDMSYLSRERPP